MTDIKEGDFVLELANGGKIVSEGEERAQGAMVRVFSPGGKELGCWDKQEWADAPEEVMGAILGLAAKAHYWPGAPPKAGSEVTLTVTLTRDEWCEMVNACLSKAALLERGDYGDCMEHEEPCSCTQQWADTLNRTYNKMLKICTEGGVKV